MEWFKKHADTVMIIGSVVGAALWMQSSIHRLEMEFMAMQKEMAIIKTVLILKNIMPSEFAGKENKNG